MNTAMLDFYPLVMESIKIQPEPQRLAHEEAEAKGETFVGVASGITNRDMYAELIKAQVKVSIVALERQSADIPDYGFLGIRPQRSAADQYQRVHGGLSSGLCKAVERLSARRCRDAKGSAVFISLDLRLTAVGTARRN